jgi:hypothetical protein
MSPYTFPGVIEYIEVGEIPQMLGVDMSRLNRRNGELICRRQIAIALMYIFSDKSMNEIGSVFGNKDHATVTYCIKRADEMAQVKDPDFFTIAPEPFKKLYYLHVHRKALNRRHDEKIRKVSDRIEMSYFAQRLISHLRLNPVAQVERSTFA